VKPTCVCSKQDSAVNLSCYNWMLYLSDGEKMHACMHACTHICFTALWLCSELSGWACTRKVKPMWILLKEETVSGSDISWTICKSAPRPRQITMPAPYHSVFYRPDVLPATQPATSKPADINLLTTMWLQVWMYTTHSSWAICKSAPWPKHITTPASHYSVFYRLDALSAAQPTLSKHWRHTSQ